MLNEQHSQQLGETADDGTECVLFEYYNSFGHRSFVEPAWIDPGTGEEMFDEVEDLIEDGDLPGLVDGTEMDVVIHIDGQAPRLFTYEEEPSISSAERDLVRILAMNSPMTADELSDASEEAMGVQPMPTARVNILLDGMFERGVRDVVRVHTPERTEYWIHGDVIDYDPDRNWAT